MRVHTYMVQLMKKRLGSKLFFYFFRLNLYNLPISDKDNSESFQQLNFGDIIWVVLSEFKYYLSANRLKDPFKECFKIKNKHKAPLWDI